MKSFEQLSEDLATRRAELKQRQREQGAAFKSKGVDRAAAGKAKAKEVSQKAADDIKSGTNKIFTGPIRDNTGAEKVPAGKTLNDGELFTTLDYYVEGVVGKIPG